MNISSVVLAYYHSPKFQGFFFQFLLFQNSLLKSHLFLKLVGLACDHRQEYETLRSSTKFSLNLIKEMDSISSRI